MRTVPADLTRLLSRPPGSILLLAHVHPDGDVLGSLLGLGLAVYGAVFALIGASFKRPLLTGLIFIFGWEPAVTAFPGYLKRFSVAYYLQALVPHAMPQDSTIGVLQSIFRETPSLGASLFWLVLIWVAGLTLATQAVERREYVLEQ